eukprot:CAMPEP_0184010502 /NCGR_PEP_ID=MMETSP0954-20121128/3251_1 /TAXON_ID=627963 /ORGANISM="Aplanochytrium sp, Strain PBS07" /LENGTH=171 /DNA_ID=CAMNT_0026290103 /DNA_START=1360 /DNA_END=1872 /DNA_ORIENTATION=+
MALLRPTRITGLSKFGSLYRKQIFCGLVSQSDRFSFVGGKSKVQVKAKSTQSSEFDWTCKHTWKQAAINTSWCLLGCSIGEFGTLAAFQLYYSDVQTITPTLTTIALPVINGLITSVALETGILHFGSSRLTVSEAFKTAMGMSFISMVSMELAMEATDYALTGGMQMQAW